jgi:hypothetical protein
LYLFLTYFADTDVNLVSFLAAEERLEEAIEFAGRALVIRIQRFGILTVGVRLGLG